MEKLVITVAPNGGIVSKEDTPYVPVTPEEIAEEVRLSCEAGASIVHLHVRNDDGTPTGDLNVYKKTIDKIQERSDIIVGLSTVSTLDANEDQRLEVCELEPQVASLNMGSVNFGGGALVNTPAYLKRAAIRMNETKTKPELEVFDLGMMENAKKLIAEGHLKPPYHFQFILGAPGGAPATPKVLLGYIDNLPENSTWGVIAWENQYLLHTMAISLGGHIRVGFEDEIYLRPGELAKSNADFIKRLVAYANDIGRPVATPQEAEKIYAMPQQRINS